MIINDSSSCFTLKEPEAFYGWSAQVLFGVGLTLLSFKLVTKLPQMVVGQSWAGLTALGAGSSPAQRCTGLWFYLGCSRTWPWGQQMTTRTCVPRVARAAWGRTPPAQVFLGTQVVTMSSQQWFFTLFSKSALKWRFSLPAAGLAVFLQHCSRAGFPWGRPTGALQHAANFGQSILTAPGGQMGQVSLPSTYTSERKQRGRAMAVVPPRQAAAEHPVPEGRRMLLLQGTEPWRRHRSHLPQRDVWAALHRSRRFRSPSGARVLS